jgi:hypothetical protein
MSTAHKMVALVSLGLFVLPMAVLAKRKPAPVVEPIVYKDTRYTVPNDKGTRGYVVAWDAATGKQLWEKTIFRKCICPLVEHDVQWVFIKHMRLDGERLILVNERGKTYSLDLKTRRVNKVKQQTSARPMPKSVERRAADGCLSQVRSPGAAAIAHFARYGTHL